MERSEARGMSLDTGNFLLSKISIISLPTTPVAPTTATEYDFELELTLTPLYFFIFFLV